MESRSNVEPPLERELAGLPELKAFQTSDDRAGALHVVAAANDNPYTWQYWFWTSVLLSSAVLVSQVLTFGLKAVGLPSPYPAIIGTVAAICSYMGVYRALHRWGARPVLRDLLAAQGITVCRTCGERLPDGATHCAQCGRRQGRT